MQVLHRSVVIDRQIHPTEIYIIAKAAAIQATMTPTCNEVTMPVTSLRPSLVEEACEPVLVEVPVLVAVPLDVVEELLETAAGLFSRVTI